MDGVSVHFIKITGNTPCFYNGLEFLFVFSGDITVKLRDEKEFTLSADQLLILDNHTPRFYSGNGENSTVVLRVSKDFLRKNCEEFLHCSVFYSSLENNRLDLDFHMKRCFSQMIVQYIQTARLEFLSCLFHLLFLLHRDFFSPYEKLSEGDNKTEDKDFYKLLNYLNEHYYERISLEKAAGLVYKSPQAFSKYFKRNAGAGFLEYLSRIRVERALTELLSTDHTITQIAADCGFVNDHAFTQAFRKIFGQTPGAYRQKTWTKASNQFNGETAFDGVLFECESLRELIRFSQNDDPYIVSLSTDSKQLPITVSVTETTGQQGFNFFKMIIMENGLEAIGETSTLKELKLLQKSLSFDYACLSNFDLTLFSKNRSVIYEQDTPFGDLEALNYLESYAKLQLTPYIRLDLSYLREVYNGDLTLYYKRFQHFIKLLDRHLSSFYRQKVHLELYCSNASDRDSFAAFCRRISFLSGNTISKELGIGIASWMLSEAESAFFKSLQDFAFSFAAGEFFPMQDFSYLAQDLYSAQKNFFDKQLMQIRLFLDRIHARQIPIYAIRWNVLSGSSSEEIGTFFRSAIILDTLVQFGGHFQGVGFPCTSLQSDHHITELALFWTQTIKRPVFFVLEIINVLNCELLLKSNQVIVAKKSEGQYAVALFCPNYVNPSLSIDHFFVERIVNELRLCLKDVPNGVYKIKRFIYSKDSSGIYEHNRKLGTPDYADPDVLKYLESAIQPELYLYREEISNGKLLLQAEISFNGIVLFLIEKDI